MPNTKKQYASEKRPGKTKRFFKALATGSTKTKIGVQNTARKTKKLRASEQKLKGFESQIKRTQQSANAYKDYKNAIQNVNKKISAMEFKFQQDRYQKKQKPTQLELEQYQNLKIGKTQLKREMEKTKAAYYEHQNARMRKQSTEIEVNKRKRKVKAYEKAAEKLTLQKFNKKRWVTGWDKKYKKASVADIHKFINVDSKLDSFKTISDSEGKPVKKLLKQFEFDDFMKHPARATEVIDSFPGVKEYSAKIGINIDRLHENQKAMLAHKMIEITKNPDMTERAMATEMVKSVVVTKFTSPEIKKEVLAYAKAPDGMGNPAPRLYNPGASSTDNRPGPIVRNRTQLVGGPEEYEVVYRPERIGEQPEYIIPNKTNAPLYAVPGEELARRNVQPYNTITVTAGKQPEYSAPITETKHARYELVPEKTYGRVEYATVKKNKPTEYLEPIRTNTSSAATYEEIKTNRTPSQIKKAKVQNTINKAKADFKAVVEELQAQHKFVSGLPETITKSGPMERYNEAHAEYMKQKSRLEAMFEKTGISNVGLEPPPPPFKDYTPTKRKKLSEEYLSSPMYQTASPGPANNKGPIYNNPAAIRDLANQSARANPKRTEPIKLKAGPNNATLNTKEIYANMNTTAEPI